MESGEVRLPGLLTRFHSDGLPTVAFSVHFVADLAFRVLRFEKDQVGRSDSSGRTDDEVIVIIGQCGLDEGEAR